MQYLRVQPVLSVPDGVEKCREKLIWKRDTREEHWFEEKT